MPTDRAILCGGAGGGGLPFPDLNPVRLDPPDAEGANTRLKIEDVRRAMVRDVPPAFLDLLEIAVYVYVADQAVKRGTPKAVDLGDTWHRRLFFRVPVRNPDLWAGGPVRDALTTLLGFLSDDEYLFEFVPRAPRPGNIQPYLEFEEVAYQGEIDEVLLFSGGLDSLAGAVEGSVTHGRRVLLVNHRSNEKRTPRHAELVRRLGDRAANRPVHLAVHANKEEGLGKEYTQRTRSFLYAALGATAAAMVGRDGFRFYENGVTSLNLPLSDQVVGARASRTTHPRTLAGLSALLTLVAGKPFAVESPFAWLTKADVVGRIVGAGCGELVGLSSSCAHTWATSNARPHCGTCSQCIDRRFSVLAAGAAAHDPADRYGHDLLTGAWEDERRSLLLGYVGLARRVDGMTQAEFFGAFGEAARALRHYGVPTGEAAGRLFDLYRRHARGVCRVVEAGIGEHAGALFRDGLPATCLVRMVLPPTPAAGPDEGPTPREPPTPDNVFRRRGPGWQVRYRGGEGLFFKPSKGMAYLHVLLSNPNRPHHVGDLACSVDRDRPRYALGDAGETIDADALRAYRVHYTNLADDLTAARERQDAAGEESILTEMAVLAEQIRAGVGLGGELRAAASDFERVRKSVGAAIRRAVKDIGSYDPALASHLKPPALVCAANPCYRPAEGTRWET